MGVDLPRLEAGHLPSKSSSFLYTRRISSYPHVLSEIMLVDMLHSVNSVTLLCTVAPCESVTFGAEKADPSVGDPRVSHHRSHRRFLYSVCSLPWRALGPVKNTSGAFEFYP